MTISTHINRMRVALMARINRLNSEAKSYVLDAAPHCRNLRWDVVQAAELTEYVNGTIEPRASAADIDAAIQAIIAEMVAAERREHV